MPTTDQLYRPLHDLRISVIDRCNFRCPYCMPEDQFHQANQFLDKQEWLSIDEIKLENRGPIFMNGALEQKKTISTE